MNFKWFDMFWWFIVVVVVLVGMVLLVIGVYVVFNMCVIDVVKVVVSDQIMGLIGQSLCFVLVIGNGYYFDVSVLLMQLINDVCVLLFLLCKSGFDVDMVEDVIWDDMVCVVNCLKFWIKSDSVVMLFFGGYGVQVGCQSYMLLVDVVIWKESDVCCQGVLIDGVFDMMKEQGVKVKFVVVDVLCCNFYECCFWFYSYGFVLISVFDNVLVFFFVLFGKVVDDGKGEYSVLVSEFFNNLMVKGSVESVFNKICFVIFCVSEGEQVLIVFLLLFEDVYFGEVGGQDFFWFVGWIGIVGWVKV